MSKPSISIKNGRLSPSASQNRSAQHSRGEILLSDFFTLPLIPNSGSHRNSAHSSIIQTASSNWNGFNRKNSRNENNIGQKMGIHRLTSREQVNEHEINPDLLEKYYIQKNLHYEREQIASRRSRISNEEISQIKKVRKPSLQITNSRCQVQKVQMLSKQITKNIEDFVSEEMTNQTTESLKHLQEKVNRVNYYQYKSKPNTMIFQDNEQLSDDCGIQKQARTFLIRKMKGVFKYIFAAMVISKQYKINKKLGKEQIVKLNDKLQECLREIGLYSQRQIVAQNKEFIKGLTNKILHFMKTPNYINQCIIQGTQLGNDYRKTSIANFSKFFLQDLEIFTRQNQLPKIYKSQIIESLYKTSKQQTSYFVGERCHFFQSTRTQIPRDQKITIAMEYLLFEIIIPQLLKWVEEVPSLSINYKSETQNNMIGIASLLQKLFVQRFKSMKKIENPNGKMVYNKLIVKILANDNIHTEIIRNNSTGDNNIVLEGLMDFSTFEILEQERPSWKKQIENLFDKVIQNIEQMINF